VSLPDRIRIKLVIPAFCAPMFMISTPELVAEACLSGIIAGLPRQNARTIELFENWLALIHEARTLAEADGRRSGILAVNLDSGLAPAEMAANLALCVRYGVEIIVSAMGNPAELTKRSHDVGMLVYADAVNLRFAEKAIAAGVDGITAIGAGGGGHSGSISHLALIPKLRAMFGGTIILAGAVANGSAIRAAEMLGADLAYLGTRFIATAESGASPEYKSLLVSEKADGLMYTSRIAGVPANWLIESMRRVGLDPDNLPDPPAKMGYKHLPTAVKPWRNLWSAGQGVELIDDVPSVAALVSRLKGEYLAACAVPPFSGAGD
jgi:nitronate monooxygenase